ncbi:MAG TPA: WcbI family polysaccharide biosynthesis putative acetyltransferase [Solirubrobacteraceae bacterium]
MERIVVVGNCQAKAVEMMLSTNEEFTKRFEFVSFPAVHEITEEMIPDLHKAVGDAAVVIPQKVDEGYREGMGLGTETLARIAGTATVVRWPSVYWAGYFPDLFYLRNAEGQPVVDGPFDYHDRSILQAYAAGLGVADTCQLLKDPEQPSEAPEWAAKATAELDIRGQDCNVRVTSFIDSRFREELLFFTMNHPANSVLAYIAQQITDLMDISGSVDQRQMPDEVLGWTFYPLHPNHTRALELGFGPELVSGNTPFKIRGVIYEPPEAVLAFFDYYTAHPDLVELNVEGGVI